MGTPRFELGTSALSGRGAVEAEGMEKVELRACFTAFLACLVLPF